MTKENVYFVASKESISHAKHLIDSLHVNADVLKKFNLLYVGSVPEILEKYDIGNLSGAETTDVVSRLVTSTQHRGILLTNSAGGAVLRGGEHMLTVRAGSAISPEHAVDLRKRALLNVLAFPTKFMPIIEMAKITAAFLMAEPDGLRQDWEKKILDKNFRRLERVCEAYGIREI